jgi:hypothetical protein
MTATATKASKARKPAQKPERRVTLIGADSNPMLVEMTIGKESFAYFVKKLNADYGMGFEFRKVEVNGMSENSDETYHVHYDPARRWSRCDCKGGEFHGHCKHQEAIVALIQSGKLPVPAAKPEARPEADRICHECGKPERGCRCGFDDP